MDDQHIMVADTILYRDECYLIQGAIFEVYKEMGSGFLEAVYQECLERELATRCIPFDSQVSLFLRYKNAELKSTYKPDLICFGKIILEIKASSAVTQQHEAQLLHYLKATGLKLGLLVNFNARHTVEVKRMILTSDCESRH
jgi:GxxExxY protein